ncbi:dinucleotide-utilizing enzyme [Microbacterium sp. 1P10UB]|uniref:dinucleotide-utilizing enzyme n=1 Tax=unclassified Microbacterium TaxID=2609290 RepID=UPI0039A2431A
MIVRPSLTRSIPFWILLVASLAVTVAGAAIVATTLPAMIAGLDDQTATGGLVYGGQSWITIGSGLLAAGLVGLFVLLALAAARSFLPVVKPTADAIEADDAETGDDTVLVRTDEVVPARDEVPAAR